MSLSESDLNKMHKELSEYHCSVLSLLSAINSSNYHELRSKVALEEIELPKKPKFGLEDLLQLKKKQKKINKLYGEDLHDYLVSFLTYDTERYPVIPPNKNFDSLLNCLSNMQRQIKINKVQVFRDYAIFGWYLDLFFYEFQKRKKDINWRDYIKITFKLSDTYAARLRKIGRLFHYFPRIQHLSITVSEFTKRYTEIDYLLNHPDFEEVQKFWRTTDTVNM